MLGNILRRHITAFQQANSEADKKRIIDSVLQECRGLQFREFSPESPLVDESIIKAKIGKVLSRKCLENFVLHKNDVLCEFDKEALSHAGNTAYLVDIAANRARYQATSVTEAKHAIAYEIIEQVKARGGRFVRVDEFGGWFELSDEEARGKVQKALRMKGRKGKRKASNDEIKETGPLSKKSKVGAKPRAKDKPASKRPPSRVVARSSSQSSDYYSAGHDENRLFAKLFAAQQQLFASPDFSIELVEAKRNSLRQMNISILDPRDILLGKKGSGLGNQVREN
jgi:hypothetical protein